MADIYVSTDDGRIHKIEGVNTAPTIVEQDIYDGVYRDIFPFPNTNTSADATYGPHWTIKPIEGATTPPATGGNNIFIDAIAIDDLATHTAPRVLSLKRSYWKFETNTMDYFFPEERVVGMSNTLPVY